MRISDWSSDVCSSDLGRGDRVPAAGRRDRHRAGARPAQAGAGQGQGRGGKDRAQADRKSVVSGKSVSVRVDLGGRRIIKKKKDNINNPTQRIKAIQPTHTTTIKSKYKIIPLNN